jgi:SAM-dependent methyltransferase
MTALLPEPSLWADLAWQFSPVRRSRLICPGFQNVEAELPAEVWTYVSDSYPRNHSYIPVADQLVAGRKLAVRVARLSRYYPVPLTSLLDLGCSKGFFVFHGAARQTCRRALGIDLSDDSLNVCRLLNTRFERRERVRFERLILPELAGTIEEFGGPFQTVLLINTYQYLFFGSTFAPAVGPDHREIFRLLRTVCSGRLIFHNRLTLADLQSDIRDKASSTGTGTLYHAQAIRQAAEEFFRVTPLRRWLGNPGWLLDAK